ncbi:hypothetical protein Acr_12g0002760 [Actinidia rufa]|uniref:Retrotransposon gag domain-containing protein n=1 Tax=Actinidia rufa TaxID=165716 RepID=A0A7J0FGE3_9ERIC|nr:hypothetical protein Acr_12g0002760 [Actinidia rufa]
MIQLLPTFYGMENENAHLHVKEFEELVHTFLEPGQSEEIAHSKLFPFCLKEKSKAWLNSLKSQSLSITPLNRQFIDMMCDEDFLNKDPDEALDCFEQLADRYQSWDLSNSIDRSREAIATSSLGPGKYSLTEHDDLQLKIAQLTRKLETLDVKRVNEVRTQPIVEEMCVICDTNGHSTSVCPTLLAVKDLLQGVEQSSQIPAYAKFLKDLCTVKRNLNVYDKAFLMEQASSIIQTKTVPKYKDLGCLTISIVIGDTKIEHALFDLGHMTTSLLFDPLESCLVVPPSLEYSLSPEVEYLYSLLDVADLCEVNGWAPRFEELPPIEEKILPSNVQTPKLELTPIPSTLKYAFLGKDETFPVVISSSLEEAQETKLLALLRVHRNAIGWTIADIKGISPLICTHHIYLEDDVRPFRQPQRHLNPHMKDVVRNEVLKLLDVGIIYPIADSKWGTIKLRLLLRTKKRQHSHAHLALSHIDECPLSCVMPRAHSKDA